MGPGILNWVSIQGNEALCLRKRRLSAKDVLEKPLSVEGHCAMSIFDGCGGMSLSLELHGVPTVCPWEVELDQRLDVVKNAVVLWQLANSGRVKFSWLAMPCRSWTLARQPLLRSILNLVGEPWLAVLGCWEQIALVDDGNILVVFTALFILLLIRADCRFALENPLRSLAWLHPLLLWIGQQLGVIYTYFDMCEYGAPWKKPTCVLHDTPFLSKLRQGSGRGRSRVVLRGKVLHKGKWVFRTSLASQYPPRLCKVVGRLVGDYIRKGEKGQASARN